MRREKRMSSPTGNFRSISNSTPLAETFRVRAANSGLLLSGLLLADSATGSARGKRTAQRTSCRKVTRSEETG
jgi:hypothetical protein